MRHAQQCDLDPYPGSRSQDTIRNFTDHMFEIRHSSLSRDFELETKKRDL